MSARDDEPRTPDPAPEPDQDDGLGAENEHGDGAPAPFAPHKDDESPLGDTDQHSNA